MKFVDAHCHLDFEAFDSDRAEVIERARAAGITDFVVAATEPATWERIRTVADAHAGLHASVGIHPAWLARLTAQSVEDGLARLAAAAKRFRVVAIGETGLDGNVAKAGVSFERQTDVMTRHMDVADSMSLPVIFHILRAHEQALRVLEARGPLRFGGVVHSYSGAPEFVARYAALNLHISFAGGVTRPTASRTLDALRLVPDERLLIETDAPDQTPSGATEERNTPAELLRIADVVARARGIDVETLAALTSKNARSLFRFD